MATLAAYDPGHGLHPWRRIEGHPSTTAVVALLESGCEPQPGSGVSQQLRNSTPQHE